jgi:hypothetical protein
MAIGKGWMLVLPLAACAAAGVAAAYSSRHRNRRSVARMENKAGIKSWENEGGNLAPTVK